MTELRFIDSHAHIDGPEFDADRDDMLARAAAAGVDEIVLIGAAGTRETVERAVALARTSPKLHLSVGVHPHDVAKMDEALWQRVAELAATDEVCAIGETGLDYYYDHSPREFQQRCFRDFLHLANRVGKPAICHIRDAHDDAKAILAEVPPAAGAVIHCFTGTARDAADYAAMGFYVSFSGIVTFKSADEIRAAVREVGHDRLLIETDCPYLAPVPKRGKRNEPSFLVHTAAVVAREAGLTVAELAERTRENTRRLFALTA